MSRCIFLALTLCLVWGCTIRSGPVTPLPPQAGPAEAVPEVVQRGAGAKFVQFKTPTLGLLFGAIVAGPDGNMWFVDENAGALVRIGMGGAFHEFPLSTFLGADAVSMAVGADGKFYLSTESTDIVQVTTGGMAASIHIPSGDSTALDGIARGPDGNVWFTEFNHIGKITPMGKITEFKYVTQPGTNQYGGVTGGSDGNVWFAESSQNAIGRIVPSTGKITMFHITAPCTPAAVVLAKDNNVWFACLVTSPTMGRIAPSGAIKTFSIGGSFGGNETMQFCARGPDGEPWCAPRNNGNVFRVNTATDTITTFTPPFAAGESPDAVAAGPDGNVWIDTIGGQHIDVLVLEPMAVTPTSLTFTALSQTKIVTVAQSGVAHWTAVSSNPSVATVTQGSPASKFNVKSVHVGTCAVTISDTVHNFVVIHVIVS